MSTVLTTWGVSRPVVQSAHRVLKLAKHKIACMKSSHAGMSPESTEDDQPRPRTCFRARLEQARLGASGPRTVAVQCRVRWGPACVSHCG